MKSLQQGDVTTTACLVALYLFIAFARLNCLSCRFLSLALPSMHFSCPVMHLQCTHVIVRRRPSALNPRHSYYGQLGMERQRSVFLMRVSRFIKAGTWVHSRFGLRPCYPMGLSTANLLSLSSESYYARVGASSGGDWLATARPMAGLLEFCLADCLAR